MSYLYRVTVTDDLGQSASEIICVLVHSDYEYATRTDSANGVTVTGFIHKTAQLIVVLIQTEAAASDLQSMIREGYEVDKVLINGKEVDGSSGSSTVENIQDDMEISVTFKPVGSVGTSCTCVVCGFWSAVLPGLGCICPWCWLILLALILSAVAFILWRVRRKQKHIQKTKVAR